MASGMVGFDDWILGTSEAPLTGPDTFHNYAGQRKFLKRLFMGTPRSKVRQGGKELSFYLFFDEQNTGKMYRPGEIETPVHRNVMKRGVTHWRRHRDHDTYVEDEFLFQNGGDEFEDWFHVKTVHDARLETSIAKYFEKILTNVPNWEEMENDPDGLLAYSLPVFNNEFQYGLPTAIHPGGAWTKVHGIDPVKNAGWRPQRVTYGAADDGTTPDGPAAGADWSLFKAFDQMERLTHFDEIPADRETLSRTTSGEYVIVTDGPGIDMYRSGARRSNDHLRYSSGHDPAVPHVKFNGIDLVESSDLRTAAIYPTGSGGALSHAWDTAGTDNAGSRFHFWNLNSIALIRHDKRWMHRRKPQNDNRQPDTYVLYVDSAFQFVCEERRCNGTVYPIKDVVWTPAAA